MCGGFTSEQSVSSVVVPLPAIRVLTGTGSTALNFTVSLASTSWYWYNCTRVPVARVLPLLSLLASSSGTRNVSF
jgi:hypothetical protein